MVYMSGLLKTKGDSGNLGFKEQKYYSSRLKGDAGNYSIAETGRKRRKVRSEHRMKVLIGK